VTDIKQFIDEISKLTMLLGERNAEINRLKGLSGRAMVDGDLFIGLKPTAPKVKRFEVGKTYSDSHTGDSQLFEHFTIKARTNLTITTEVHGKIVKRRLYVYEGVEQFKPFGSYSMAMIVNANDSDRRPA
jgi:hypothetical protein